MSTDQRIKFTEKVTVHDEAGREVFSCDEGQTAVLPRTSAERWIRRGKAVLAADEPPKQKRAVKKAAKGKK